MADVVQMPTGRQRKRRLRTQCVAETAGSSTAPAAPGRLRRYARRSLVPARILGSLVAHFSVATAAVLFQLASRLVYIAARLAFMGTAIFAIIECFRGWQDLDIFLPLAAVTGVLLVLYIVLEGSAATMFRLQHRTHHRRPQ